MPTKQSQNRIGIVLIIGLFLATFVLINAQEFLTAAFLYLVLGVLSLFLYNQWGKVGRLNDLEGIDSNFVQDGLVGLGLGVGTILLSNVFSFIGAIGIPPVQSIAGTVGRFIIVVPVAAIFEEAFFRDFLMDLFNSKLKFGKIPSNLLTAIGFSIFHLSAYGEQLSAVSGSFFTAALMGFIFGLVTERQNSLAGSMVYHATLNTWIGFIKLAVIVA